MCERILNFITVVNALDRTRVDYGGVRIIRLSVRLKLC